MDDNIQIVVRKIEGSHVARYKLDSSPEARPFTQEPFGVSAQYGNLTVKG